MQSYIVRRLLILIPTLLLVSFMIFSVMHLIPGNIVDAMMASPGAADAEYDREAIERSLGLDAPLIIQYARWIGVARQSDGSIKGLLQGELGTSWQLRQKVSSLLSKRFPVTIELTILSTIISLLISLPIGVYSAIRQDKIGDFIGRTFAILSISLPSFWVGTMVVVYPSIWWGIVPEFMYVRFFEDPVANLKMLWLPSVVLGMSLSGLTMRMTRTTVLETLRQDYVRTAWSKGLRERNVIIAHVLKNSLIPVVTIIGISIPNLLGGTVIIENIFVLPGMGRLLLNAANQRDYPVVTGVLITFSVLLLLINILTDLTYGWLDPRIRYK